MEPVYLSIQPAETGKQIKRLLLENGYTIREIQGAFGFEKGVSQSLCKPSN